MILHLCDKCKHPCESPDQYWNMVEDCASNRILKLEEAIRYALSISLRQHGDDYPYDDCWKIMRKALEE